MHLMHQEWQVYIPEMFSHLNRKEPGMNPLEWSPSFRQYWSLLSTPSNILRVALWELLPVHFTTVHRRFPSQPCPPCWEWWDCPGRADQSPSSNCAARQGMWIVLCAAHETGQFLVLSKPGWRVFLLKTAFLLHVVKIKTSLQPPSKEPSGEDAVPILGSMRFITVPE